ncbi:hypothetical protein B0H34DRAFT_301903 [Crassisporium funariophilum]|nr:hypothetical protein B0H34DRAFT_301903 [Crassisporium funariophilum]
MPPKAAKGNRRASKEVRSKAKVDDFGGLDPGMMMSLMKKIPKNPATGRVDLLDIMKYMEENPSEMSELMGEVDKLGIGKSDTDLSTFNYEALAPTIVHESAWVIQLESMGFVDRNGKPVDPDQASGSTGVRPTFMLYCYDEKGSYRLTRECVGLPEANTILDVLQRAIAEPLLPLKPCLPWFLLLSIKLQQHVSSLKPFLDSLPSPFHWRLETREEAEGLHNGVDALNQAGARNSMSLATKAKTTGNDAFHKQDRISALRAYSEALKHLIDVLCQKPDSELEGKAKKLQAVCYANRAAAYLIPGKGIDMNRALKDGQDSEKADPSYNKAYIRQATSSRMLGKMDDAQDAIVRALRRKDLENDVNLVDCLIDLMTGGKGMSDNEETFKNWLLDVLINDRKSSTRLRDLGGEWRRRCDVQFAKFKR